MSLRFAKYLIPDNITSTATKYGFTVPVNVEKFIMDFEMQYQISTELDCITRGGMCMPFHTNEDARRLSIDIDLLTQNNVHETEAVMNKINQNLDGVSIVKISPTTPYPMPNLLSYTVGYRSCFGRDDHVKVDFLCDVDILPPKTTIQPAFDIFNFSIDYPVDILTHGSLIGDKLTTLALEKIGLPQRRFSDIPKQIYDIGTLLKLGSESVFSEAFSTFENFTKFKVDHYKIEPPYTVENTLLSIENSLSNLLNTKSNITLTDDQNSRFGQFKGTFLGNSRDYKKTEHIEDVLLIRILTKLIYNYVTGLSTLTNSVAQLSAIISQLQEISGLIADTRTKKHGEFYNSVPDDIPFNKRNLNGAPLEHVFLIREYYNLPN